METKIGNSDYKEAWQMVLGQLRPEMNRADFKTWVDPIVPLGFNGNPDKFRIAVMNDFNKKFINSRLNSRISRLLSGLYKRDVEVEVIVSNQFAENDVNELFSSPAQADQDEFTPTLPTRKKPIKGNQENSEQDDDLPATSKRKFMLQRAYGNERANIIQPDKGIYVTKYFLEKWLPLLGHSALIVIMMTRKVCYWNPYTGEKRDILETEMGELAEQACVSVRTLKTVLKNDMPVDTQFVNHLLEPDSVGLPLRFQDMGMGTAKNDIDHIRMFFQDGGKGLQNGFNSFTRGQKAKGEQYLFAFHLEFIFVKTGINKGHVRYPVMDKGDFLTGDPVDILQEIFSLVAHDNELVRQFS